MKSEYTATAAGLFILAGFIILVARAIVGFFSTLSLLSALGSTLVVIGIFLFIIALCYRALFE